MLALDFAAMLGLPEPWVAWGALEALVAAIAAVVLERVLAVGGERPAREGLGRALTFGLLAATAVLLLVRVATVVGPGIPRLRALAGLAPVVVLALGVAAGDRTTRAFRERVREAAAVALAFVLVAPALACAAFAVTLLLPSTASARGVGGAALAVGAGLLVVRVARLPAELALVVGVLVGARAPLVQTLAFPGVGARLRRWERASHRLAAHGGDRSHRVAIALASPEPTFVIDWLRPAVQLVVDRSAVLRVAPAMPAPELVEALAASPEGVLAARELHPYLVGAVDVHAAQRALELRGAGAAALLRDDESQEILGVLYALRTERDPLTATEARVFRRLSEVVAASIVSGSEPAIAARLKSV